MADDPPRVVPLRAVPSALLLDPRAPFSTAKTFIEHHYSRGDLVTLIHQQGTFAEWTGTHYRDLATEEMRSALYDFLEASVVPGKGRGALPVPFKPSARAVSDVLDALRAASQLSGLTRAPAWLGEDTTGLPPADEIISCKNGLLHLPTGDLFPHTPSFYATSALSYAYDEKAPEPVRWNKFLSDLWPDDPQPREVLQDVFGYLIGSDTDQQKILMAVGPKRSGKGTIARIVTAVIGQNAVVSPTLASLESNFGLAPLIGKSVALIADARLGGRADQHAIAERLLSISGEDLQTVDRKHIQAWSGRLGTRFFILSNELPRISDASGALSSRFIILTMTESFYGKEDRGLTNALMAELPGILNWAIAGWRRLRKRGHFIQPKSSEEAMREFEDLSSPIGAFVRDACELGPTKSVVVDKIFDAWVAWCKEQARDHFGTKATFGKELRAAVPQIRQSQPREGEERVRKYEGIGLKPVILHTAQDDDFHNREF